MDLKISNKINWFRPKHRCQLTHNRIRLCWGVAPPCPGSRLPGWDRVGQLKLEIQSYRGRSCLAPMSGCSFQRNPNPGPVRVEPSPKSEYLRCASTFVSQNPPDPAKSGQGGATPVLREITVTIRSKAPPWKTQEKYVFSDGKHLPTPNATWLCNFMWKNIASAEPSTAVDPMSANRSCAGTYKRRIWSPKTCFCKDFRLNPQKFRLRWAKNWC